MAEHTSEIRRQMLPAKPASGEQMINSSPPLAAIPDLLKREKFNNRYQFLVPSSSPSSLLSPPPLPVNRIALSDRYKSFRRKVQPIITRDPRQQQPRKDTYRDHRQREALRAQIAATVASLATAAAGQTDGESQLNQKHDLTSNEEASNCTFRIPTLMKPMGDRGNSNTTASMVITSAKIEQPPVQSEADCSFEAATKMLHYKKPSLNDYIFGFRGDVFMELLKMKLENEHPKLNPGRLEIMQLNAFLRFLTGKRQSDDSVSEFFSFNWI